MFFPMLIAVVGLVLVFNFGLLSAWLQPKDFQVKENQTGKVLGVSETWTDQSLNQLADNQAVTEVKQIISQVISQAKDLAWPSISATGQLSAATSVSPVLVNLIEPADFNLAAKAGVVLDCQKESLIYSKNAEQQLPIASLTKLVSALVFLQTSPDWQAIYQLKPADRREGNKTNLFIGEKVKVKDLFYTSLIASDNTAMIALISSTGLDEEQFVEKMNQQVKEFGLEKTIFKDATGLSNENLSTASEIARLAKMALANAEISQAVLTKSYEFFTPQGRKKIIYNTNELLNYYPDPDSGIEILGGKTGFQEAAGYCLVSKFKNQAGQEIIVSILGASDSQSRFNQAADLVNLVFEKMEK